MGLVGHPWCTQACIEVAYMLGGQPLPHGFLSHVICYAKALPVYLLEEGWCQLLHPNNFFFCRLCLTDFTHFLLLCPPVGFSVGYPPPIGSMMMSLYFLLRPHLLWVSHPIRAGSRPDMPFCACAMHSGQITLSFISLPAFEG